MPAPEPVPGPTINPDPSQWLFIPIPPPPIFRCRSALKDVVAHAVTCILQVTLNEQKIDLIPSLISGHHYRYGLDLTLVSVASALMT